jgi:hypothetical protein
MELYLIAIACVLSLMVSLSVRAGYLAGRRSRLSAGRRGETRVSEELDLSGGQDRLDDIVIGITMKRSAQIDHLVRGVRALVVVETKNWRGSVEGGLDDRLWKLTRPNGEVAMLRNPVSQAARQARIVRDAAGSDAPPILSVVVMAGRVVHASGKFPEGVLSIRDLQSHLPKMLNGGDGDPDAVQKSWDYLVEDAFSNGAQTRAERYVAWLEDRFGEKPWHGWLIVSFALAGLLWTMSLCLKAIQMRGDGTMF